jgi:hypothetical protein
VQILNPFLPNRKQKRGFPNLQLPATPLWNEESRLLIWGDKVIFHFSHPAPNLELLLNSLVKHTWPHWTPNPFRPTAKHTSKYLLREAIKNWNYSRLSKYIRLHSDGAGTGFHWERMV